MSPYVGITKDYAVGAAGFAGRFEFGAQEKMTAVAGGVGNTFLSNNLGGMCGINGMNGMNGSGSSGGGVICQSNRESPSFFNLADEPVPYEGSESLMSEVCYGNNDDDEDDDDEGYGEGFELFDGNNNQLQQ